MKNKKGFTLIELLAVIVILAVIMVIAVPKILDIIESSRNSAADSSLKLVRSAIKTQVATASMSSANFTKEDGCYLFDFTNSNSNAQNLSLKNKDNVSGSIKYCNGKLEDDTLAWDGQTGNTEPKKPAQLTNDLDKDGQADIGDTITIGEENFYVISNNGSTISMLAYYNLDVGGTYKQDETMKGWQDGTSERKGTVIVSDTNGWEYKNNETIPTSYYNSELKTSLDKYSEIITKSMGKEMTARLIKKQEIDAVVNDGTLNTGNIKSRADANGVSWIYNTSYWTGTAYSGSNVGVWSMYSSGKLSYNNHAYTVTFGVRPVLDISVSDL